MTLRRTGLARKSELRRTPMPRRTREVKARGSRAIGRQRRSTGPSAEQRAVVVTRAAGRCELCGERLSGDGVAYSIHHRQARGAGGTRRPEANYPSNLLLVCGTGTTGCHGSIESNRDIAYDNGWLVRHPTDPATVPVWVWWSPFTAVLLDADGGHTEVTP